MGPFWDYSEQIRKIGTRFHVILTDFDMLPLDFHLNWLAQLPQANIHIINSAGHLVWIDQPVKFKSTVNAIFK